MRTHLAAFVALGLSWGVCSAARASDHFGTPLPGALGRFCGIGYSAGYHARYPSRPGSEQHLHSFAAPAYSPGLAYGPVYESAMCPECSAPTPQVQVLHGVAPQGLAPQVPGDDSQQPQLQPQPALAPAGASHTQPIQQPSRDSSPSDRAGFFKRLPNMRGAANVSDLPAPPSPPKKASVARSSILQIEAR